MMIYVWDQRAIILPVWLESTSILISTASPLGGGMFYNISISDTLYISYNILDSDLAKKSVVGQ